LHRFLPCLDLACQWFRWQSRMHSRLAFWHHHQIRGMRPSSAQNNSQCWQSDCWMGHNDKMRDGATLPILVQFCCGFQRLKTVGAVTLLRSVHHHQLPPLLEFFQQSTLRRPFHWEQWEKFRFMAIRPRVHEVPGPRGPGSTKNSGMETESTLYCSLPVSVVPLHFRGTYKAGWTLEIIAFKNDWGFQ